MKKEITNYLKTDRSYNSGVKLYNKYGTSGAFKQKLNLQVHTDYMHNLLHEQLRVIAGISENEFKAIMAQRVAKASIKEVEQTDESKTIQPDVTLEEKKVFKAAIPEEVRKSIRLRDEFPFLASTDCPQEFKILVHDMLTAYSDYVAEHKRLFEATTGEELQEIAGAVVENYIENREIWDELNHYKTTGQILGKHPLFAQTDRIAEIKAMTTAEHVKLQRSLMNNIARTKKNIADNPEHKNTADRKASVAKWEVELEVVNGILGLDA